MNTKKRKIILVIIITVVVLVMVRLYSVESKRLNENKSDGTSTLKVERDDSNVLPKYMIINQSEVPEVKLSLDIRLFEKISETELKKIAVDITNHLIDDYDRIFIVYYLPKMTVGNGGWATSHFNPDLKIKILGISLEEEILLLSDKFNDNDKLKIGSWADESPYTGCIMTLYEKNNSFTMKRIYGDGTFGYRDMKSLEIDGEVRYVEKAKNSFGEYYTVDKHGDLGVYDNQGWIFTAIKK